MGKHIIVLSDGTGNSAAQVWRTNVWRIFESLDLRPSDQVAIYDDGVGTSSFKPMALLGGAFGFGLKRNVLGLYKFLCRNYRSKQDYAALADAAAAGSAAAANAPKPPYEDDKIFLFGFSRGAFTVRILAGLVVSQGLVHFSSEAELAHKARAAYRAYRSERYSYRNVEGLFRKLRNLFATHTHDATQRPVDHIWFMGVWDTVAAYGSPIDEITRGFSQYIWPLELPNQTLSDKIHHARQALAIDEERTTFAPVLWDEANSPPRNERQTVSQVWFAGVHSNVGGGYPDDSLAKVSLNWMMTEAAAPSIGLRFKVTPQQPDALKVAEAAQDKDGRLYDSRSGIGGYYRYGPRKISDFYPTVPGTSWIPRIHESVLARIAVGAHLYAPIGFPSAYEIVRTAGGQIVPLGTPLPGARASEDAASATLRREEQESVWDLVWKRRVTYFLTVFASIYTALYPLVRESYAFQEMATRLRIISDTIRLVGGFLPAFAERWVDGYARDPFRFLVWAGAIGLLIYYSSTLKSEINSRMRAIWNRRLVNPALAAEAPTSSRAWATASSAILAGLVLIAVHPLVSATAPLQWLGRWNDVITSYSEQPLRFVVCIFLMTRFMPEGWIQLVRTKNWYKGGLKALKFGIFPFVFAVLIAITAFTIANHLLFNIRDSFGVFCQRSANNLGNLSLTNPFLREDDARNCVNKKCTIQLPEFDSAKTGDESLCVPTGVFAERGKRYSINVQQKNGAWTFWNVPSDLGGQPISRLDWWKQPIAMLALPLRRSLDRPWGSFIVRYGPTGNTESFLDREPPPLDDGLATLSGLKVDSARGQKDKLGEAWTAPRDGELYIYLNKPVLGIWGLETLTSKVIQNTGTAAVTIRKLSD